MWPTEVPGAEWVRLSSSLEDDALQMGCSLSTYYLGSRPLHTEAALGQILFDLWFSLWDLPLTFEKLTQTSGTDLTLCCQLVWFQYRSCVHIVKLVGGSFV